MNNKILLQFRYQTSETYPIQDRFIVCKPFESRVTSPREPHKLCIDCIRGHCHAAADIMALAPDGIGLRCPDPSCRNVLHFELLCFCNINESTKN